MNDIRARVAYLQGLAEGLDIDTASSEGRVLTAMIDVLGDLADQMTDISEAQDELAEYVEAVDYDLGDLEESFHDETEEIRFVPEEDLMQEEDGVSMLACPECNEVLAAGSGDVTEAELNVVCPACGCVVYDGDMEYEEDARHNHGVRPN